MIINGIDTNKFRLKVGILPIKIDPNDPGRIAKFEYAKKVGLGPLPGKNRTAKASRVSEKKTAIKNTATSGLKKK